MSGHSSSPTEPDAWEGRQLGSYSVTALLGSGGMGRVWRARDTRLGRDVAIKALPDEYATDPDRLVRFEREARLLAALNHPNIAAIYGLEEHDGIRFLVLELVEGETLADRLKRGRIPVREALGFAAQIAEALEAAHETAVIHRDLKPANIKVTPDGKVKVLDFGLARAAADDLYGGHVDRFPTVGAGPTVSGVILGTPAYMSPEQARGELADRRADIWAFGCVLLEMLTGRSPFAAHTFSETLAKVIGSKPDLTALPRITPALVRRLIQRCLEADRRERLQHIGDARLDIQEALTAPAAETMVAPRRSGWLIAAVAVAVIGFAGWWAERLRAPAPEPPVRSEIAPQPGWEFADFLNPNLGGIALSPDGTMVAYVATTGDQSGLWVRPLDPSAGAPRLMRDTVSASHPFWSPDSMSIGFGSVGWLRRLDVESGRVTMLAPMGNFGGGAWLSDGRIVFSGWGTPLSVVSEDGGDVTTLTRLDAAAGEVGHRFPQWIDGDRVLYHAAHDEPSKRALYAISLARPLEPFRVMLTPVHAVYDGSDHLFTWNNGTLLVQEFDPATFAPRGDPRPVAEQVTSPASTMTVAISRNGRLLYAASGNASPLHWFEPSGRMIRQVGDWRNVVHPRISRDGRNQVFVLGTIAAGPAMIADENDTFGSVTQSGEVVMSPVFSPDQRSLVASARRPNAGFNLLRMDISNGAREWLTSPSANSQFPSDWSRDGRILYSDLPPGRLSDLRTLAVTADGKPLGEPRGYVQTAVNESWGVFSPEAKPRWVAYQSLGEDGFDIYVQAFPIAGPKFVISVAGGVYPKWTSKGLYYAATDSNKLVRATLKLGIDSVEVVSREVLFPVPTIDTLSAPFFDVTPDGTRFLVTWRQSPGALTLITNWPALLKNSTSAERRRGATAAR